MAGQLVLRTAIGRTAEVLPIWDGRARPEGFGLDLVTVDPLPPAFRQMIRQRAFDLSEMPVVTLAQARERGHDIVGLPFPVSRRFHHGSLLCATESPIREPRDMIGRRMAVRSYPQTSGVWVRGLLAHEYGVPVDQTTWLVQEDAHVEDYDAPEWVVEVGKARTLVELLSDGEVDAVAGLHGRPEGLRPVIPDADAAAAAWFARTGIFPVNHVLAIRGALLAEHPGILQAIGDLFKRALDVARADGSLARSRHAIVPEQDIHHYDFKGNRASMQMLLDFSFEQKLTGRAWRVEDLFEHYDFS